MVPDPSGLHINPLHLTRTIFIFFFPLKEFSRYFKNRLGRILSVTADFAGLLYVCLATNGM